MSDVANTPAPTAAPEASPAKPAAGSSELIAFHARQAQSARLAEMAEANDAPDAEPEAEAGGKPKRGTDGKFKPKAKAAEAAPVEAETEGEEPAAAETTEEAASVAAGLHQVRKLVKQGDIAKALAAIGLSPEKLEGRQWGAFRQREAEAKRREHAAVEKESQLRNIAGQLEQRYGRFDLAQKALENEDYDQAFQLAFNISPDDYTRKRVHAMQTKDPEVAKLKNELKGLKLRAEERERAQAAAQAEANSTRQREAYRSKLASDLESSDDARFSRVAKKPAFVQKVFDIQKEHYDASADTTIDLIEAAELAWEELYEGVAGDPSSTAAKPASKPTVAAKNHARPTGKPATTLNMNEAAEASPATRLKGADLLRYYARKAELALQAEG